MNFMIIRNSQIMAPQRVFFLTLKSVYFSLRGTFISLIIYIHGNFITILTLNEN